MRTAIVPLNLRTRSAELRTVYQAVFAEPPWNEGGAEGDAFVRRLADEHERGARGVGLERDGELLGFAYALPTPRPFPTGRAYDRVAQLVDVDRLERRWEISELAIHPTARGAGHGTELLTALLDACSPAWLLTSTDADPARRLYDRHPRLRRLTEGAGLVVYVTAEEEGVGASECATTDGWDARRVLR